MATFTPQPIGYTGVNVTFAAPEVFPAVNAVSSASERQFLWVKNSGGSAQNVIIVVPGTTFEQANTDVTVSVPAGSEKVIGPLNDGLSDPSALGAVLWVHTVITGITCAVVTLPDPPASLPV